MALIVRAVTLVATTAKKLATTGFGDPVILQNLSTVPVYIGGDATVTSTNGFKLNTALTVNSEINLLNYSGEVWGYADGGAGDVRVIECISG